MGLTNRSLILSLFAAIIIYGCKSEDKLRSDAKLRQYTVEGLRLYRQHCANCHQVDGTGLASLIPPLKDSDYLSELENDVFACQIINGVEGEIVVNGITFSQAMPGNQNLTPLEVAEIITYVNQTWGRADGLVDVKFVEKSLNYCTD